MLKRLAMMAITAALALVPVTAAHASSNPLPPDLQKLEFPCVLKKIKPPSTGSSPTSSSHGPDTFDVESEYADDDGSDTTVEHDGHVEQDDYTYPC
jgi:hypothetical protein